MELFIGWLAGTASVIGFAFWRRHKRVPPERRIAERSSAEWRTDNGDRNIDPSDTERWHI